MKNWRYILIIFLIVGILVLASYITYKLLLNNRANKVIKAVTVTLDETKGEPTAIQQDSIKEIVAAWQKYGDSDTNKLAYILATARHESRFQPIKEIRANPTTQPSLYNTQNAYWNTGYYGRGFIQLTHQSNYQKMSDFLGVDFVSNPDLVLNPKYSAQILVYGMMNGSFAIKKPLAHYINANQIDFYNARRTVNGTDKAQLIADYANQIKQKLDNL